MFQFILLAIAGWFAAPVVAQVILGAIGIGVTGPVAGGIAAGIQAGIGNVAAGSVFSVAQSVAMGGTLPIIWNFLCGAGVGLFSLFAL